MAGRLEGKVALVVGAGAVGPGWGNGKAAAVLFAREGASLFCADVSEAAARETARLIESDGGTARAQRADATRAGDVAGMVEACVDAFGRIDILHNNVGASAPGGPVEMAEETWDAQLTLNLKPAFLACKHALPVMEAAGGGAVVNVASVAGLRHLGRAMIAYATAKAGLVQFTRELALQYAGRGIRANCVVPGLMNTPLVSHRIAAMYGEGDVARTIAERDAQCPMGHMGDAWDVAHAALFLASDEAKYVTATEIVVDGGLVARAI